MKDAEAPIQESNPWVYILRTEQGELNYEGFRRYRPRTPGLLVVCRMEDSEELWLIRDLTGLVGLRQFYQDLHDCQPDVTEVYQFLGDRDESHPPVKPWEEEG